MEGDIVLKKKKTTNVNKRAPGHVPCVTADCGGISRAISLSDWTYLICSMNGSSTLSPGESVRLNLPKRSMIHASCWGTNLTTCVCVCHGLRFAGDQQQQHTVLAGKERAR